MKKYKGITLVALVVTIVVLLIISGVAISMITGYNGLFGMANSSANKYNQNSLSEQQRLQELYSHLLLADSDSTTLENIDMTTLNALIDSKIQAALANVSQVPTGTIIAQMGNAAPTGYLVCDGGEYEISAYQALANYFETQFGNKQYFGGTGTKFKVPDLSGEFLRGTGTAERNKGTGAAVGVHQDATSIMPMFISGGNTTTSTTSKFSLRYDTGNIDNGTNNNSLSWRNNDGWETAIGTMSAKTDPDNMTSGSTTVTGYYRVRPTNTAVLYCIKV